jgi:hypothetical protein
LLSGVVLRSTGHRRRLTTFVPALTLTLALQNQQEVNRLFYAWTALIAARPKRALTAI